MRWFGNRNREGHGKETPEVKPRNQILQTSLDKEKPSKSWELLPEQKKAINKGQVEIGKKYSDAEKLKLKRPQGTDDYKEELQKQLGDGSSVQERVK